MNIESKTSQHLATLQKAIGNSYADRSRKIRTICIVLLITCVVTITAILNLISSKSDYGIFAVTVGALQVLFLIFIVLGLILHAMALGRVTSAMLGTIKINIDLLTREIGSLTQEVDASEPTINTSSFSGNVDDCSAEKTKLRVIKAQLNSLFSELETTVASVNSHENAVDMAQFSYGFAALCFLSAFVLAIGATENAEYLRVLLLLIGTVCAIACYIVLSKPTNSQAIIDQSLRKLGLSVESLSDSMRSRDTKLPLLLDDFEVFEPMSIALEEISDGAPRERRSDVFPSS